MELLKNRILTDGKVIGNSVLKVDNFLNHQLDIKLFNEMGKEFRRLFEGEAITKILTVEASGIAIASIAAQYFDVPVVFAKKYLGNNMDSETYEAEVFSFTKNQSFRIRVSKKYISHDDRVLIIDDFLANGRAILGMSQIVRQAGARVVGAGIAIEKAFQNGRAVVEQEGIRVKSLAIIESMEGGKLVFKD
ncbi:MAG: xanthine phosphoribosyltransferase [Bacillota bacterium]|nr:xanthine phosphoribosyltransferase [Bacillota bacterium]